MKVITITNQKGGVGKSTTASALNFGLKNKGYKTLLIDLDAQGNLSYTLTANNPPISSLEVLTGTATIKDAIQHTAQGDILPASPSLAGADTLITETGKEYRLKEAIETIINDYDYILIDTPPALGTLTINALTACDSVIIPAQADIYSLQGIGQLIQTIQTVKKYCNPNLTVKGILITRYNTRTVIAKDMTDLLEQTANQIKTKLFNTKIRECVAIKEAQAMQTDIFTYAPNSNASTDYRHFTDELIKEV